MTKTVRSTWNDVMNSRFYQLNKFLFEGDYGELSNDARVLYSLLRDRHDLSIANNWVNEDGEVFIVFARKKLEALMRRTDKTIKKAFDELKKFELIDEERMGLNRPNRIYIRIANVENKGIGNFPSPESEKFRFKKRKNSELGIGEFPVQESEKFRLNDTDINKTKYNDTKIQSINNATIKTDFLAKQLMCSEVEMILNEMKNYQGIPCSFIGDKKKVTIAIHNLTDYENFSRSGYHDEKRQAIYEMFVTSLIDMLCVRGTSYYANIEVNVDQIVEVLNKNIDWSYDGMTIFGFVDSFVLKFEKTVENNLIKALVPYMKSCIWNSLLEYKIKLCEV